MESVGKLCMVCEDTEYNTTNTGMCRLCGFFFRYGASVVNFKRYS